jgi:hypothetical protein
MFIHTQYQGLNNSALRGSFEPSFLPCSNHPNSPKAAQLMNTHVQAGVALALTHDHTSLIDELQMLKRMLRRLGAKREYRTVDHAIQVIADEA